MFPIELKNWIPSNSFQDAIKQNCDDRHFVLPGLTNSHDHLEFNLFPKLRHRIYEDYVDWGNDIHSKDSTVIKKISTIPLLLRIQLGVLKNLLQGITTVVHHGVHHPLIKQVPFRVFLDYHYVHSLRTDKWWRLKMLKAPFQKPILLHLAEGVSPQMHKEVDLLQRANLLNRPIIAIHGIGVEDEDQLKKLYALVWCPDSNFFLYGKTAPVEKFKRVPVLFGTDSNVSSSISFWEQLRVARATKKLSDEALFNAIAFLPKNIFKIKNEDDFVLVKRTKNNIWDSIYSIQEEDIDLVVCNHQIVLADDSVVGKHANQLLPVIFKGRKKWLLPYWHEVVRQLEKLPIDLPFELKSLP